MNNILCLWRKIRRRECPCIARKIVCGSINLNKRVIDCMVVYAVSAVSQPWRFLKNVINCVIHLKRNIHFKGRDRRKNPTDLGIGANSERTAGDIQALSI